MNDLALRAASVALGSLPDGVGQFRIAQRLIGKGQVIPHVREVRMRNGTRMALDLHDRTQGIAFLIRRFDAELATHIIESLPLDGVFIDAGANVGLVSFAVALKRPFARVFAFEPYPATADIWERNKRINMAVKADLVRVALSDISGTAELGRDFGSDSGSGRLGAEDETTFEVETVTLDDFAAARGLERIDVLKLDVQGHEPEVLRGAQRLLQQGAIRTVLVEANDRDLLHSILSKAGYSTGPILPFGLRRLRSNPPMSDVCYYLQ